RICPIETPEGPNIGLIGSLATYGRINSYGFIETPYRKVKRTVAWDDKDLAGFQAGTDLIAKGGGVVVKKGAALSDGAAAELKKQKLNAFPIKPVVTDQIEYLPADEEEEHVVAQANARLDNGGHFVGERVPSRFRDQFPEARPDQIEYMDVSPKQVVSVATALIPFLEHDDANRALMGSNMQRQAVPLLEPESPIVGTGMEARAAQDSGQVVMSRSAGVVTSVTAERVQVEADSGELEEYRLLKFVRSNQGTCINQRPIVTVGQRVDVGTPIADSSSTQGGELALGRNVLVAFMSWEGGNYEDAIVISERLVRDDLFTSIHIEKHEIESRDTKLGPEEITRDIPNVGEEALKDLDEEGIVYIGAEVRPGDILVGKITPKGETELSPEEKLLTAIFGEKAKDVKDSSLKVPPGMEGVVIDVKIFSRIEDQVVEKDRGERIGEIRRLEGEEKIRVNEVRDAELMDLLEGQTVSLALKSGTVEEAIPSGTKLTGAMLRDLKISSLDLKTFRVEDKKMNERIRTIIDLANDEKAKLEEKAEERIDRVLQPDELPPGVIQLVKVYMAEKRKVSVGDKMAGRHGNKGIVARIVPEEDMPFLPDGRPVDIVLNPLGVPSRMNVGQILETHLGWAARLLGFYAKTPVFQGANEREIGLLLKLAAVAWVRDALDLKVEGVKISDDEIRGIIADVKAGAHYGERVELLADATIDSLGARGVSAETRDVYNRIRDFVSAAARELAERDTAEIDNQIAFHSHGAGDEEYEPAARAQYKAAAAQIEKKRNTDPASVLASQELPSLAAALGTKKSEVDVDAAAMELMRLAGISAGGKVRLRDGRTGETFANPVTVGEIYMLKLSHLVDDKIHARSIGPYSLVTQQPLAGKAQFGGQRFGEMEVWALEAYGAAHTLQEILTVKSDDVNGRSRVYEAIVKGQNLPEPGIPESFNVLVQELKALGIHVSMGANATSGYGLGNIGSRNGNGNGSEG
ncbi:MAG: DNA-directed RNA polymerase subunit beta, partial [Gemmatimonadaceae bacterium]